MFSLQEELQQFARRREEVFLCSSFRVCNLQGALDLVQEVEQRVVPDPAPRAPATSRRWLPRMTPATNSKTGTSLCQRPGSGSVLLTFRFWFCSGHAFPVLPVDTAWLFATRPIFLYPELLPVCSLDHRRHHRVLYTPGENGYFSH